ncbi:uncharacterized protein LOC121854237 [Homarus americanus]|uniref:uncharacterized protein LOC121854237 n=1 Tax=Homarus americanus TaxID=6706 RepID=UPI001C4595CA|nr:uncharacterized protein LOC121854237 [Homarus americanus]
MTPPSTTTRPLPRLQERPHAHYHAFKYYHTPTTTPSIRPHAHYHAFKNDHTPITSLKYDHAHYHAFKMTHAFTTTPSSMTTRPLPRLQVGPTRSHHASKGRRVHPPWLADVPSQLPRGHHHHQQTPAGETTGQPWPAPYPRAP